MAAGSAGIRATCGGGRSPSDEPEKRGIAVQKLRWNVSYLTKKPAKIRDLSTTGVTNFAKSLRQR
jgi:hypothetical protein